MEKIKLFTNSVEVAEHQEGENLVIKVCLCDFNPNLNNVQINRDTIADWMGTLVNAPIVGKIVRNPITGTQDFSGHNVKVVINEKGEKEIVFDTRAYGTITACEIDDTDHIVITAEIFARFEKVINLILNRVASGELNTSWEISVIKSHMNGDVKVIDQGIFLGHTLLGKDVEPAYPCSKLLECASDEETDDDEFIQAISDDMVTQMKDGEDMKKDIYEGIISTTEISKCGDNTDEKKKSTEEDAKCGDGENDKKESADEEAKCGDGDNKKKSTDEEAKCGDGDNKKKSDTDEEAKCGDGEKKEKSSETEQSALTTCDLYDILSKAACKKLDCDWCYTAFIFPADSICWVKAPRSLELEYIEFHYTVTNDVVEVSDPIYITLVANPKEMSSKLLSYSNSLVETTKRMNDLQKQVDELSAYKEAFEKEKAEKEAREHAEKEKEITSLLLKSGYVEQKEIDTDDAVKKIVSEVNYDAAKILIADRMIASLKDEKPTVETSSTTGVKAQIEDDETGNNPVEQARLFITKKN